MRQMWIGGAIALAILSTIPARASGVLPVTTKTIHASTSDYEITFAYPQTGVKTIDDEIATWAKGMVADFEKSAKTDRQPEDRTYTLDMSFDVARNDVSAFAVAFDEDVDTGGAHPNHDIVTFNYLMPDGWRVYLPEIFENTKGLARISELAMADLEKQLSGPDAMSDSDEIKSGAGLNWENFKDFILLRDALILRFPPYQVAAYAAGPQEVRIPLSALRDVMRVDWRTPTASFDCFRATAPVERAICSDITLSRLDRDVAQAYGDKLSYETVDANKTAIKAEQRAWLTTRNTVCKDQEGPGMVSCLTGLYRARLAALTPQP